MNTNKRILITGAGGFVGSRIAKAMQGDYEILTPGHKELDITSENDIDEFIR